MSFIRKKKMKDGKVYAYEVTAQWDAEKKQSRAVSKYLGVVDEDGTVLPKGTALRKRGPKPKITAQLLSGKEHLIQDFGNGFFVHESIKQSAIYAPLADFFQQHPELLALMTYRLCHPGPMYMCAQWLAGNVLSSLDTNLRLSSQDISRLLALLGEESVQRAFFERYLQQDTGSARNVIIDATSLPNNIQSDWSAWGYSDGGIEMQFRFHCVVDQLSKKPLFYRCLPGNISDISTLNTTIQELQAMGVTQSFALLDSGFCSEENIRLLRKHKIDFLTRLPAGRCFYKNMVAKHAQGLEKLSNACRYGKRTLFIERHEAILYQGTVQVYLILDAHKKAKDLEKWLALRTEQSEEKRDDKADKWAFDNAGLFILISSKTLPTEDILAAYYTRPTVEQIFGFAKSDLELLPIRCHSEPTIRGYLFLQFLLLTVFIEIRQKLANYFTVDQAIMILAALKCKIFQKNILIQELTKNQKAIFNLGSILVPTNLMGI
jgi:transposase